MTAMICRNRKKIFIFDTSRRRIQRLFSLYSSIASKPKMRYDFSSLAYRRARHLENSMVSNLGGKSQSFTKETGDLG